MEDIQLEINKQKPEVEKLEKLTTEQEELLCKRTIIRCYIII